MKKLDSHINKFKELKAPHTLPFFGISSSAAGSLAVSATGAEDPVEQGGYTWFTWLGSGTVTVDNVAIRLLVVGGGGGSSSGYIGGGGGGQVIYTNTISAGSFPTGEQTVSIGGTTTCGNITANSGGSGGSIWAKPGDAGGSGGGGGGNHTTGASSGGASSQASFPSGITGSSYGSAGGEGNKHATGGGGGANGVGESKGAQGGANHTYTRGG